MVPARLLDNRAFVGLNLAALLIYAGLSVMFFLLPFDLIDRRGLSSTGAALAMLPFTLGLALLSPIFGNLADATGPRVLLITGPLGAALAYVWLALGQHVSLVSGVLGPMAVLGIAFAMLVAPLTASVLSSVESADEGLVSGINNAISRIAQLIGVALAASVATYAIGYQLCLIGAALLALAAATTAAIAVPAAAEKSGAS